MNKKKTNYIVVILNVIVVILTYIYMFLGDSILNPCFIKVNTEIKSIYNSEIMDFIANNIKIIMIFIHSVLAIFNIISAIQNKKDRKICFWQLLFGLYEIYFIVDMTNIIYNYTVNEWKNKVVFGIIPIILVIMNFICARKNEISKIKIISYIVTIIIALLTIFNVFNISKIYGMYWEIIILLMLFIYINKQEIVIEESKTRRIINIILYYIIQLISVMVVSGSLISLMIISKIHEAKWKNEITKIYNNVIELDGITNEELYMPVEKNGKYGFINEKGQEKIKCEYDRVTYFVETCIEGKNCYFALVEQNKKYYIISKSNNKIDIGQQEYLKSIDDKCKNVVKDFGHDIYTTYFSYALIGFGQVNKDVNLNMKNIQNLLAENKYNQVELKIYGEDEIENSYYENEYIYNNGNYSLILKPIKNNDEEYEEDYKFKVTIKKVNGEESTNIEYLPTYNHFRYSDEISTYRDGSIPFESLDGKIKGFYDVDGNKISFRRNSDNYEIVDVKDDKVIIDIYRDYEKEDGNLIYVGKEHKYYIYDINGKLYLKANEIIGLQDIYLVKDEENKVLLYDKNLNKVSNQYDRILPNGNLELELSTR